MSIIRFAVRNDGLVVLLIRLCVVVCRIGVLHTVGTAVGVVASCVPVALQRARMSLVTATLAAVAQLGR